MGKNAGSAPGDDGKAMAAQQPSQVVALEDKQLAERLNFEEKYFFPERFLSFISTDKPIYNPGDTAFVRITILHSFTHTAHKGTCDGRTLRVKCKVQSPKGDTILEHNVSMSDSTGAFNYLIPSDAAGGDYELKAEFSAANVAPSERKFNVQIHQAARLRLQLEFDRKGLGPGDNAVAKLECTRSEGGVPENANVSAVARIDGDEVFRNDDLTLDGQGHCTVEFKLPDLIKIGDGTLTCTVTDGGVVESTGKTIPIVLRKIDCRVYPEGGNLVAGCECGLYIEAFTAYGDPADMLANVCLMVGDSGDTVESVVGSIVTEHEGRGYTTMTPVPGRRYELRVIEPAGVVVPVPLPRAVENGVALRTPQATIQPSEALFLWVESAQEGDFLVSVCRREREVTSLRVHLEECVAQEVVLTLPHDLDGVLRVTIFDEETELPVTERLTFRRPAKTVTVDVKATKDMYTPGSHVGLTIATKDQKGKLVDCVAQITVVDDSVCEKVERRRQVPRLPTQFFLESEVKDMYDGHVYLYDTYVTDPERPPTVDPETCLDLLLGTQGWRRFIYHRPDQFVTTAEDKDKAHRVLGIGSGTVVKEMPLVSKGMTATEALVDDRVFGIEEQMFGALPGQAMAKKKGGARGRGAARRGGGGPPPRAMFMDGGGGAPPPAPAMMIAAARAPPPGRGMQRMEMAASVAAAPPMLPRKAAMAPPPARPAPPGAPLARPARPVPAGAPARPPPPPLERRREAGGGGGKKEVKSKKRLKSKPYIVEEDEFISAVQPGITVLPGLELVMAREYAYAAPKKKKGDDQRTDFLETLYFNAGLKVQGQTVVEFDTSDLVTSFRAFVDVFALPRSSCSGAFGLFEKVLISRKPFYAEPKIPNEVTLGDHVHMPVMMANSTESKLECKAKAEFVGAVCADKKMKLSVAAGARGRVYFPFDLKEILPSMKVEIKIKASAGKQDDVVSRVLRTAPLGFPQFEKYAGTLVAGVPQEAVVDLPQDTVPGSLNVELALQMSSSSTLTQALAALIREPCGCFEQTSATTYPMVMALHYYRLHVSQPGVKDLIQRATGLLQKGLKKLLGFECQSGGFEWFGSGPGHEALTAYGVMQFYEMREVIDVNGAMLDRTMKWLLRRRDGKGEFLRNKKALDSFGRAPPSVTNAYVTWAIAMALKKKAAADLVEEIKWMRRCDMRKNDAYFMALLASVLHHIGEDEDAQLYADALAVLQKPEGYVSDLDQTICRSFGAAKNIETTALSVLAWLPWPHLAENASKAANWLRGQCCGGRFGSTQSTILALKALIQFEKESAGGADGVAVAFVNGKEAVRLDLKKLFKKHPDGLIKFEGLEKHLIIGERNSVKIAMEKGKAPFTFKIDYSSAKPDDAEECPLRLSTKLTKASVKEGEGCEIEVKMSNETDEAYAMTVAIIGIPGGTEPRTVQLKELVQAKKIDFFETRGREVILYWRQAAPHQKWELKIDLVAMVPGDYTGPASRAYLYYGDEYKVWNAGLGLKITAEK